jgi:hypothetical protein
LMRWASLTLWAGVALAAGLAVAFRWPLRFDLSITRGAMRTRATVRVSPWPFLVSIPFYHRDVPPRAARGAQWNPADLPETLGRLRRMVRMIASVASLGHKLIELTWHSSVGTGDAACTAIACGQLWTIKSALAAWAYSRWGRRQGPPAISVSPAFDQTRFHTALHLVVETNLAVLLGDAQLRAALMSLLAMLGKRRRNEPAAGHEY